MQALRMDSLDVKAIFGKDPRNRLPRLNTRLPPFDESSPSEPMEEDDQCEPADEEGSPYHIPLLTDDDKAVTEHRAEDDDEDRRATPWMPFPHCLESPNGIFRSDEPTGPHGQAPCRLIFVRLRGWIIRIHNASFTLL